MARCSYCAREMFTAKGCVKVPVPIKGKGYMNPIKVGGRKDFYYLKEVDRCGDCGAQKGGYHHRGCDIERCPNCGGQLFSCDCSYLVDPRLTVDKINEEMAKAEEKLGTEEHLSAVNLYVLQSNIHEYRQLLIDKANGLF